MIRTGNYAKRFHMPGTTVTVTNAEGNRERVTIVECLGNGVYEVQTPDGHRKTIPISDDMFNRGDTVETIRKVCPDMSAK